MKANLKTRYILPMLISLLIFSSNELAGQRLSRDFIMDLWVNQTGFVPEASKAVVTKGLTSRSFEVINTATQEVAYRGQFNPEKGDFGDYSKGDFSALRSPGKYYVKADTLRSYPFLISSNVYRPAMDLIVGYFSLQRCGNSTTGYLSPCHLDDGIRMDNGKHQDVSGGWHDASDLRKWIGATIYGMIGLGKAYELYDKKSPELIKILDELKWGNLYFLKMQEPQGYIMNFVGGDVKKHSDSNRWTDNQIGPEGGELAYVKPAPGRGDMLIFGRNDDRVIRTDALEMTGQYNFITSEAIMARITKKADADYSKKCLDAAARCFKWCTESERSLSAGTMGAAIQAAIEMYKTTKEVKYRDFAVKQAAELKKLQVKGNEIGGFFLTSSKDAEPYKNISRGCLEFISVCDLVKTFPDHADVPAWKSLISDYANNYLSYFSHRNSFGIIPFGLFTKQDPGGNRRIGEYWYRYFMHPELSWWVGINANIASAGVGLMKAAEVLNDPKLTAMAQQQLDWIIGVNPFNSSTIVSVGYNNPVPMLGGNEFRPATPLIPGAVMNGLGGDKDDQPFLITKSNYQQSEYWTPMVAYTLWLMAEITM